MRLILDGALFVFIMAYWLKVCVKWSRRRWERSIEDLNSFQFSGLNLGVWWGIWVGGGFRGLFSQIVSLLMLCKPVTPA